jgi:hypothetical protein
MRLGHLEATWRLQLDFRTDLARQAAQIVSRFVTNNPAHRRADFDQADFTAPAPAVSALTNTELL